MDGDSLFATAANAVREAGTLALASLGAPGYVRWAGYRDLVTGSALDVQSLLVERLRASWPDHAILADDGPTTPADDASACWVVDAINGRLNYAHGIPQFAVCLALRVDGVYQLGIVYDPARNELFHAARDGGAYLNGQPITVAQFREGAEAYANALVGADYPADAARRKEALQINRIIANDVLGLVSLGSPALGLCYLAAGRLHAYYHLALTPREVAAPSVILTEAGAILTNAVGGSWLHGDGGYLATNGIIHGWLLRGIMPVLNARPEPPTGAVLGEYP